MRQGRFIFIDHGGGKRNSGCGAVPQSASLTSQGSCNSSTNSVCPHFRRWVRSHMPSGEEGGRVPKITSLGGIHDGSAEAISATEATFPHGHATCCECSLSKSRSTHNMAVASARRCGEEKSHLGTRQYRCGARCVEKIPQWGLCGTIRATHNVHEWCRPAGWLVPVC